MALLTTMRDLHRRKGREHRNLALAEGIRLVEEMLATGVACKGVAVSPSLAATDRGRQLESTIRRNGLPVESVTDTELAGVAATEHPQGVVAMYQPRRWAFDDLAVETGHPLVLLDGVQDPGNVGTIARTARAFGAAGLVALPGTADLTNPKTVRSAMGALFSLPHLYGDFELTTGWLERRGIPLWVAMPRGDALIAPSAAPLAIAFGNEGGGVNPLLVRQAVRNVAVPVHETTESLNVAVAAGIALFVLTR